MDTDECVLHFLSCFKIIFLLIYYFNLFQSLYTPLITLFALYTFEIKNYIQLK